MARGSRYLKVPRDGTLEAPAGGRRVRPAEATERNATAMYPKLVQDLARAKLDDRLARAEAQRLAIAAKQSRPPRRHPPMDSVSVAMQALLARFQARRPEAPTARTRT
jgi:hypothetical protein